MNESEIYERLTEVFREVLDDDTIALHPGTKADDVPGWDSQAHIELVIAAEERFGVHFRTADLDAMKNVGDFVASIARKLQ